MRPLVSRLIRAYGELVNKRPFATQVGTAGVLVTVADIISQKVIERKKKYDFRRTAVMSACGFFYFGPLVAVWFSALNRWGFSTIANVAMDQLMMAPILLSGFFILQSLLMGKGFRTARHRLRHELPGVIKVNFMVWVPAQIINFQFMPFQYRMLFAQTIALFWNCYLSNKTNKQSSPKHDTVDTTLVAATVKQ